MRKDQKTWIVWGVVAALFLAFFFWIGSPQKFAACGLLDPKSGKILFGCWGKGFFEALTDNFDAGFRAFSGAFNKALETLVKALLGTLPVLQENLPIPISHFNSSMICRRPSQNKRPPEKAGVRSRISPRAYFLT